MHIKVTVIEKILFVKIAHIKYYFRTINDSISVNIRGLFGKFVEFGHKIFNYRYAPFII